MVKHAERLNSSVTESAANTYKATAAEVPNSSGAKSVWLTGFEIDIETPDAVTSGWSTLEGQLMIGHQESTTSINLAASGVVSTYKRSRYDDGSNVPVVADNQGPYSRVGPVKIPRHVDNKYYVTIGNKGTGQTDASTVRYSAEFIVED